jgi:hypothetical protein
MEYRPSKNGSVPVLYCRRQQKWLPMEEHEQCEYCAAPVYDADGRPVSFLCTYDGEKREFQPGYKECCEEGYGAPAIPPEAEEEIRKLNE